MADTLDICLDVASALSLGARQRQEDALVTAFAEGTDVGFAVLSDGMGGHAAGDVASRIIVTEIFAELTLRTTGPEFEAEEIPALLRHSAEVANTCLGGHIQGNPATQGMGGTVVATLVQGNQLFWLSVGDSPLFLYRDGVLSRLNEDHSMGPQIDLMAKQGLIDEEAARNHPQRNCLTAALIGEPLNTIDCPDEPFELLEGDVVVAASDGLEFLADAKIAEILRRGRKLDSRHIAQALMSGIAGIADPEQDNTSVVVIKAEALAEPGRQKDPIVSPAAFFKAAARVIAPARHVGHRG